MAYCLEEDAATPVLGRILDIGRRRERARESLGVAAFARFVRDHPEITSAVVFGRHDTLVNFPDTKDKDSTGRTPVAYLAEDHAIYRDFAKLWKESTKIEKSEQADLAGSLVLWLADHRGIAAVRLLEETVPRKRHRHRLARLFRPAPQDRIAVGQQREAPED